MAETQQFARVESLPPAFLQQFFAVLVYTIILRQIETFFATQFSTNL